jgi:hypothetical protein
VPGSLNSDSVIWDVDSPASGVNALGVSVAIPGDSIAVTFGSGAPSGAPTKGPLYINTANHKLHAWNGSAWVPVSGFNT